VYHLRGWNRSPPRVEYITPKGGMYHPRGWNVSPPMVEYITPEGGIYHPQGRIPPLKVTSRGAGELSAPYRPNVPNTCTQYIPVHIFEYVCKYIIPKGGIYHPQAMDISSPGWNISPPRVGYIIPRVECINPKGGMYHPRGWNVSPPMVEYITPEGAIFHPQGWITPPPQSYVAGRR